MPGQFSSITQVRGFLKSLPRAVLFLGCASFFTDIAGEAIYPILPLFIAQSLGGSVLWLSIIEGCAELTASLTKYFSGKYSDQSKVLRNRLVLGGYSLSALSKPLFALTSSASQVFGFRLLDRLGKGVRSAPRDAWLASCANEGNRGRVFGVHRAMDNFGAVVGPLLASLVLLWFPGDYPLLFSLTALPGVAALLCIALAHASEQKQATPANTRKPPQTSTAQTQKLPRGLYYFLGCTVLFALGNSSDAFIILKLQECGVPIIWIPVLWGLFNLVKTVTSLWGGAFSDRKGPVTSVLFGWSIYALMYLAFAFVSGPLATTTVLLLYAAYFGLCEAPEKALVSKLIGPELRGRAFGLYHLSIGFSILPASLLFGLLWQFYGSTLAFLMGSFLAILATFTLALFERKKLLTKG